MKHYIILIWIIFLCSCKIDSDKKVIFGSNNILPSPFFEDWQDGYFQFTDQLNIAIDSQLLGNKDYLINSFKHLYTFKLVKNQDIQAHISLIYDQKVKDKEQYELKISTDKIEIFASDPSGCFYGIQSLLQMMPTAFHNHEKNTYRLQNVHIKDQPKFAWRGLLLDCCRHFFDKKIIKKYIDLLAFYKMNTLHWHLTEDQGWRIQIDSFPRLTQIGSWRNDNGQRYGGFYSKEDIREILTYAKERHINVIPEIELPGHAQAAIASYPNLSCTGDSIKVATKWGVFKDVYCAGNEQTFDFLEKVLTEVLELFPSKYIHIGGDECPKFRWHQCEKCQKRIKDEALVDEEGLQRYFIQRINTFLNSKGRTLVGWDEILEGGHLSNTVIQSWRGMNGALEAAKNKQYAIASPTSHAYFDYKLDAIDLKKVFEFNPIPSTLADSLHAYILGGECNMWTEHVPDEKTLDSKVFPRLTAMSEVLWSSNRDYDSFYKKLQQHYPILEAKGVQFGAESVAIKSKAYTSTKSINLQLEKGIQDLNIYYTTDGSEPDSNANLYESAIPIKQSCTFRAKAYRGQKIYGQALERQLIKHKANGLLPDLEYTYSPFYTGGGEDALTNGILGSLDFRDGNWQAVQGSDIALVIDLEDTIQINGVGAHFLQKQDSWIFLPTEIELWTSNDNLKFSKVAKMNNTTSPSKDGVFIQLFEVPLQPTRCRYVKFIAKNIGICPNWHAASGAEAWLFADEIIIQ